MEYRDQISAFRDSCRIYNVLTQKMNRRQSHLRTPSEQKLYEYIFDDVQYVEEMMQELERKCGRKARDAVWSIFVDLKTHDEYASQTGQTRRQVQYAVDHWLHALFGGER